MPLEAALQVNQGLLGGHPLRRLLLLIARRAQAACGASLVAVCTVAEDGTGHAVRTAIGRGSGSLRGWTVADGAELRALLGGRQARSMALDAGPWPAFLPPGLAGRLGPAMVAPAVVQERTVGVLLVANPAGAATFTAQDLALAELFATQAAIAIEYQGARAAVARLGLAEDRERIEEEVYDGVAQTLFGVGLSLQTGLQSAEPAPLRTRLEEAIRDIDDAVERLRAHIGPMRPTILPDLGLELALRRLAAYFARRAHLTIDVEVEEAAAARVAAHKEPLLLAVSERLAELVRRADISTCHITLYRRDGLAVLELADDGRGIHPEDERLREIQELVRDPGVDVTVEIRPELGATLRATLRD